jgi:hypothetical protein
MKFAIPALPAVFLAQRSNALGAGLCKTYRDEASMIAGHHYQAALAQDHWSPRAPVIAVTNKEDVPTWVWSDSYCGDPIRLDAGGALLIADLKRRKDLEPGQSGGIRASIGCDEGDGRVGCAAAFGDASIWEFSYGTHHNDDDWVTNMSQGKLSSHRV